MNDTSRVETREISDADLDNISGGLSVTGTLSNPSITGTLGPNGVPVITGAAKAISVTVSDIPIPGITS